MPTDTPIKSPADVRKRMDDNPGATTFALTRSELDALLSCFPYNHPPASIDVDALASALHALASALHARMNGDCHA
jgi:hypothetical protein